ncbi:hypothetical protein HanIR_Chr17g0886721 [Helianthus annuus]|nr:hypothetical protein HanIR_Chr17g0886721 [Helianthus annuus]
MTRYLAPSPHQPPAPPPTSEHTTIPHHRLPARLSTNHRSLLSSVTLPLPPSLSLFFLVPPSRRRRGGGSLSSL